MAAQGFLHRSLHGSAALPGATHSHFGAMRTTLPALAQPRLPSGALRCFASAAPQPQAPAKPAAASGAAPKGADAEGRASKKQPSQQGMGTRSGVPAEPQASGSALTNRHVQSAPSTSGAGSSQTSRSSSKGHRRSYPKFPTTPDSLRFIPGIGPKYEERLRSNSICTVSDLRLKYEHDREAFAAFLKEKVGINNTQHIMSVLGFFRTMEMAQARSEAINPQVTLSVEGNIGAGKSTFLSILNRHLPDKGINFIKEPVEKWQKVGGGPGSNGKTVNLLELFYNDPDRMAYTFQNYVFLTRVMQERETYDTTRLARLLERSIFSDRMVFVRAVHAAQHLSEHELQIYDSWFGPILQALPTLIPNGFIYLRARPETCMHRLKKRARSEETGISIDYLGNLHERHEDWLHGAGMLATALKQMAAGRQPQQQLLQGQGLAGLMQQQQQPMQPQQHRQQSQCILSLDDSPPLGLDTLSVPSSLANNLYFLDASKVSEVRGSEFLHQMPALVVECDDDVDVDRDLEFGSHVSRMVEDYTQFVAQYRAARTAATAAAAASSSSSMPGFTTSPGGVLLPGSSSDYWTREASGRISYRNMGQPAIVAAAQQQAWDDLMCKIASQGAAAGGSASTDSASAAAAGGQ